LESDDPLRDLEERDGHRAGLIGNVNYLTGRACDMRSMVRAAHAKGAHMVSHLALAPEISSYRCTRTVLISPPGALQVLKPGPRPGRRLRARPPCQRLAPRFEGWWGHDKAHRFEMGPRFSAIREPRLAALQSAHLQLAGAARVDGVVRPGGMPRAARKGDRLTGYLEWLLRRRGVRGAHAARRGSMLTVPLPKAGLERELGEGGAVVDLRPPDIVRITPPRSTNSFEDVHRFCARIAESLDG